MLSCWCKIRWTDDDNDEDGDIHMKQMRVYAKGWADTASRYEYDGNILK